MESGKVLEHKWYDYSGPCDLCGGDKSKMRQLTAQQAQTQASNAAADRARQLAATGKVSGIADQLMSTGAGKLSPWSSANYASNMDNIAQTYNNMRSMGFRALGQSGFGSSPGATASLFNTAARNQAADQTQAYRNALSDTLNQNLAGANLESGIANSAQAGSQFGSGQSVADAQARMNMGSTLGDIGAGISTLAPIVAAPFTGGASLGFGTLSKPGGGGNSSSTPAMPGPWSTGAMPTTPTYGFGNIRPGYANTGVGTY